MHGQLGGLEPNGHVTKIKRGWDGGKISHVIDRKIVGLRDTENSELSELRN
jgi:hypothetical protein